MEATTSCSTFVNLWVQSFGDFWILFRTKTFKLNEKYTDLSSTNVSNVTFYHNKWTQNGYLIQFCRKTQKGKQTNQLLNKTDCWSDVNFIHLSHLACPSSGCLTINNTHLWICHYSVNHSWAGVEWPLTVCVCVCERVNDCVSSTRDHSQL